MKILVAVVVVLHICHVDVSAWERVQAWSFANEQECQHYYANMNVQEGWCPAMWDGLLCWPPAPYNAVALLPCPPNGGHLKSRTVHKRCTPDAGWETPRDASPSSGSSTLLEQDTPHLCLLAQQTQDEGREKVRGGGGKGREEGTMPDARNRDISIKANSRIEQRYAQTTIMTTMRNSAPQPDELKYKMTLPENAYITSLIMEIDGVNYTSTVRKKDIASRTYQEAKERGEYSVLITKSGLQEFEVSARVVSQQVIFYLKYEELLHRINGNYIQKIYIHPGYRIPESEVSVHIIEREPIEDYRILELPGQELSGNPGAQVSESFISDGEIKVNYKHVDPPNGKGVDGTFTIAYHLQTHNDGGEIQRMGDYFTHFLSLDTNERFQRMTKHTVFALDLSNSMAEGKLNPLKTAMKAILETMSPSDSFEILAFSSDVASLGKFNGTNIRKAVRRIRKLQPIGYSNLNDAYLQALKSVESYEAVPGTVKQIVMITDGKPTKGVMDPKELRKNIGEANRFRYPIYAIGLGVNSDFNLIKHISVDSHGFARHLPSRRNVAKGILEFFKEISNPILTNLAISYAENEVDPNSVVKLANTNFYSGGEAVAVGQVRPGVWNIHPWVTGLGKIGPLQLQMDRMNSMQTSLGGDMVKSPVVRLWALLMIQHLLSQAEMNDDYVQVQELTDRATDLALKFTFVTPVTSLVIRDSTREYDASLPEFDIFEYRPITRSFGPSELQSDAPQPPRLQRYEPKTQLFVDNDPHFVSFSPGMKLPICFDVHAHDNAFISLIHDQASGTIVNGALVSSPSHPKLTYIRKLFLSLGQVNITITTEYLEIDCIGDDGNPKVGSATKTLWPFYKRNGRKYRKWMANRDATSPSGQGNFHDSRNGLHSRVSRQTSGPFYLRHRDSTYVNRGLYKSKVTGVHNVNSKRMTSHQDELQPNAMNYIMNSNFDNYIVQGSSRRMGYDTRTKRRMLRHSVTHQKGQNKKRSRLNSGELCRSRTMWEEGTAEKYGDVLIILNRKKKLHIIVGDGEAEYVVFRSKSNDQLYLGYYIHVDKILSPKSLGLLGQFVGKNITVSDSTPVQPSTANSTIELIVSKLNRREEHRTSTIQGVLATRRSMLEKTRVNCIEVQKPWMGLLDGRLDDYLLSCLEC